MADELDLSALTEAASQLGDDEIRALLADPAARAGALDALAAELPRHVDPAAVERPGVVLRLHLTDGGEVLDVRFAADGATATRNERGAGRPDATLAADAVDMLRLLTGQADAAVLVLRGRLAVEGDVRLAISLASAFRMPGADHDLDVRDVDPDAMAAVIAEADDEHLRAVFASPVRDVILEDVFGRFPEHVREERLRGVDGVLAFKVTRPDGDADRFRVAFRDGRCLTGDAAAGGDARVTIVLDGPTLLRLVTGNLNPPLAFLTRKLRIKGDIAFAAQLPGLFRIPSASAAA
jgi:putative sterol carrier protein